MPTERYEYSVVTRATPEQAWSVYSHVERWPSWTDYYDRVRWTAGEPWKVGSHLRLRFVKPIPFELEQVVVACTPAERVGCTDHAMGTTMIQWVTFPPVKLGGTEIAIWAEFTGMMPMVAGKSIRQIVDDYMRGWYDRMAAECDRVASGTNL